MKTFTGTSLDDLMRYSVQALVESGERITPTRGAALELHPVSLTLLNPRARISRTEARGRLFSALGETCWYLSGTADREFISYYLSYYERLGQEEKAWGGYGTRLFHADGFDQVRYVISRLRASPDSRKAVIQIFDHNDVAAPHDDVPCTCVIQYLVRGESLDSISYMRSNDFSRGLSHDVFAFTMLQELIARSLDIDLGAYTHVVGSYHLYEKDLPRAEAFLAEGWQSAAEMPPMPQGNPWPAVDHLLAVERDLRAGQTDPMDAAFSSDSYWADLERLLAVFSLWRLRRFDDAAVLRKKISHPVYQLYVSDKLASD